MPNAWYDVTGWSAARRLDAYCLCTKSNNRTGLGY